MILDAQRIQKICSIMIYEEDTTDNILIFDTIKIF